MFSKLFINEAFYCVQVPFDPNEKIKINTPIAILVEEGEDWQNVELPAEATEAPAAAPSADAAASTSTYSSSSPPSSGKAYEFSNSFSNFISMVLFTG
jgi:pyruvate/2-oxoglutarate dehydrogenase complex dihydrolipoamide acyltransferase (E2) component